MFLYCEVLPQNAYVRTDFIQGSAPEQLERAFEQKIAALVEENAERSASDKLPLGVIDVGLSSVGTDFICHLVLSDRLKEDPVSWTPDALPAVVARFWMGADAEALGDYQEAAIAAARGGKSLRRIAMGVAGLGRMSTVVAFIAGERF